jgi:hypothetical protein
MRGTPSGAVANEMRSTTRRRVPAAIAPFTTVAHPDAADPVVRAEGGRRNDRALVTRGADVETLGELGPLDEPIPSLATI